MTTVAAGAPRTAVVTGAASGIGRATAAVLAARGHHVAVADLDEEGAVRVAADIGARAGSARGYRVDVTDEESVAGLMDTVVQHTGRLDVLVANAGVAEVKQPVHELDMGAWSRVLRINLDGVVLSCKHALRHMVAHGSGSVITLSSVLGIVGQADSAAYSAAKAAVANLTRSMALTYAPLGIRVNAVAPGYVRTPLLADLPPAVRDGMVAREPIGRLAEPEEIARAIAFLAGDDASFVVGAVLPVDGGYTAV